MALPIIDIRDTNKLADAMQRGITFRIKHGEKTYSAYNEIEEQEIAQSNARAEADILAGRVLTHDEFWASMDKKIAELSDSAKA